MTENNFIILNPNIAFYLLKHFSQADKNIIDYILQNTIYTKQQINEQLAIVGSKFYTEFAKNPLALFNFILTQKEFLEKLQENYILEKPVINITFDKNKFPDGIGCDGICNINSLNSQEVLKIKFSYRNGHLIKILNKKPASTWNLNIILKKSSNGIFNIKTIFPGTFAPPLPQITAQSKNDFLISSEFWKDYLFVEF